MAYMILEEGPSVGPSSLYFILDPNPLILDNAVENKVAFIQGFEQAITGLGSYLEGVERNKVSNLLNHVSGHEFFFVPKPAYVAGNIPEYSYQLGYIAGIESVGAAKLSSLIGSDTISNFIGAYQLGSGQVEALVRAFIHTYTDPEVISNSLGLMATGHDISEAQKGLWVPGRDIQTALKRAFLHTDAESMSGNLQLLTVGHAVSRAHQELWVPGQDNISALKRLFVGGLENTSSILLSGVTGHQSSARELELFVRGLEAIVGTKLTHIGGWEDVLEFVGAHANGHEILTKAVHTYLLAHDVAQSQLMSYISNPVFGKVEIELQKRQDEIELQG